MSSLLARLSAAQRIYLLLGLSLILAVVLWIAGNVVLNRATDEAFAQVGEKSLQGQRQKLAVATHSMALAVGEAVRPLDDPEARIAVIRALVDDIRFEEDQSGYYFVYRGTVNVALPPKKEIQGKDLANTEDVDGVYFVRELERAARAGGGFVRYVFPKPGAGDVPKLAYAEMIPGTDLWIGTGVYLDNVEAAQAAAVAAIDNRVKGLQNGKNVLVLFLLAILAPLAWIVVRSLSRPLRHAARELDAGAQQVTESAASLASSGNSLAEGTSQQAASLEETTASLEEISSMVRQNADNIAAAEREMQAASSAVGEAGTAMERLDKAINEMKQASEATRKVVNTIDEIAFQTNILALNAAVEAARAGEAGAGFAVVAEEVRALAGRSAEAARNTADLINGSIANMETGVAHLAAMQEAIGHVQSRSGEVSHRLSGVTEASREQTSGLDQISKAMQEMDSVVQNNAANAEECSAAAQQLDGLAGSLSDVVRQLSATVHGSGHARAQGRNGHRSGGPRLPAQQSAAADRTGKFLPG